MIAQTLSSLELTSPAAKGFASPGDVRHILADFRESERRGLMLASFVRAAIVLGLVMFFAATGDLDAMGYAYLVLSPLGLALIGAVQYALLRARRSPHWAKYAFAALDCAYLTALLGFRHMASADLPSATVTIKEGGILFFFAFLVHGAFTYSPRFVIWIGFCISLGWLGLLALALHEPGTTTVFAADRDAGAAGIWSAYGSPHYLPLIKVVYDFVVLAFLTLGLAVATIRSRRLVLAAAQTERSRANLARHFSPRMVEVATRLDRSAFAPVRQDSAILFADIRGFTSMAEAQTPEQTVDLLRRFHARMQERLFAVNGTLDRIMGDGFLATFGVPAQGAGDPAIATSALACAQDMRISVRELNAQLNAEGLEQIDIGVGLHFGPVMFGDIGSAQMSTFTVVGDTVNVASRLQAMTRSFGVPIAISADFVARLAAEGFKTERLRSLGVQAVRGRQGEVEVFTLSE
jgi:adenylate cyclase